MKTKASLRLLLLLALIIAQVLPGMPLTLAQPVMKNGFDLTGSIVPVHEILSGGPPRDGIPAIDSPKFLSGNKAASMNSRDPVLGVSRNGINKAYPIAILNWHEIVNDQFGSEAIVVSFCPLCGSGVAFTATASGRARHFGVSGLLYNSDVLLYDRETDSLWSQLMGQAISGPLKGTPLKQITMAHTSWGDWLGRHPDTLVLSRNTGFKRDYERDPYAGYADSNGVIFPVSHKDPRFHPKERVIGVEIDGQAKAYPFSELAKSNGKINDQIGAQEFSIVYDDELQSGTILDQNSNEIVSTTVFWFAWYAFHPGTLVYRHQP